MESSFAAGWLKQRSNRTRRRALKYTVGILNEKHLPQVMALQEVIVQNLQQPDLLHSFSRDFMKQHMEERGVVLGVFVQNRLIAFRNLYYPELGDKEWNLGLDLGLAEEELAKVANLQLVCVHPRYRGNGLALKMNQISLGLLRQRGTHPHVCATVSPYNIWNIPVLLASGFHIAKLKSKYGGKIRYIVYQDLRHPIIFDDQSAVWVRLDDLDTQKRWLCSGFYGVALRRRQISPGEDFFSSFDLVLKAPVKQFTNNFGAAMASWKNKDVLLAAPSPPSHCLHVNSFSNGAGYAASESHP